MSSTEFSGASNPEYVNARVRARKASLFSEEEYRKLVRMGTGEVARYMEESEYETEINQLGARFDGVDLIEFALNQNLAKHFEDLLRWADGQLYAQIARYLRKFDAWNLKTVIRGLYSEAPRDEIEADLIRAGEFSDAVLESLLDAGSIEEVVELVENTIFGAPLADALGEYEDSGLLVPLENAIDRAFFEHLHDDAVEADRATELYVEFLEAEIDFRNVRNALRIAQSSADIDPADYFIDGGTMFDEGEIRQLSANRDELIQRIRDSRYGAELSVALDDLEDASSLIAFERALETGLLEFADHLSHVYPLSICPVLGYVLNKEREVENIRAIARGREAGLDEAEIEAELVIT